jgi:hypothetical protein
MFAARKGPLVENVGEKGLGSASSVGAYASKLIAMSFGVLNLRTTGIAERYEAKTAFDPNQS